jgi:diaminopropionate ammonia-lyase
MDFPTLGIEYLPHPRYPIERQPVSPAFSVEAVRGARRFHHTFPQYEPTPLVRLSALARELGVAGVWIKDESRRFDLNSFKVLGGSYAVARYLAGRLGIPEAELSFERLRAPETQARLGTVNFVTATDGNHGRAVAWSARELGHRAVVFMPAGSAEARVENNRREGAEVHVTDGNYDETIRTARAYLERHGGVIIQDTAWEEYEDIPTWIMQGYAVCIDEAAEQVEAAGISRPTHVFLQAGVGSFAGGAAGYLADRYGTDRPHAYVVEPREAACYYESVSAGDGKSRIVTGEMPTMMAGLACGEPNSLAWPILRDHTDGAIRVADPVAAAGMRALAHPLPGDPAVEAGDSAAAGLGIVLAALRDTDGDALRDALGLSPDSHVLVVSTEGNTDPENYRRVVREGAERAHWE